MTGTGDSMADDVTIPKTEVYKVRPKQPITLSVLIGERQLGSTAVTLDYEPVGAGADITDLKIGKDDQDLRNSILDCVTTVKDANPDTNNTSVIYALKGGQASKDFPYSAEVSTGGRAIYV